MDEDEEPEWHYDVRTAKRRKRASSSAASRPSPREIGLMRGPKDTDGSASFLGSSSGIYFVQTVYDAFARRSADLHQTGIRSRSLVPGEDDHLQRIGRANGPAELWLKDEELDLDTTADEYPSFEELIRLSRGYFEIWHPIFPHLHAPTVLHIMEAIGDDNEMQDVSRYDWMILRSIFTICLADSRQVDAPSEKEKGKKNKRKIGPIPANLVFQTIAEALDAIHALFLEPPTLSMLQAAFSIQLTLSSLLRLNAASRVGGVIVRTAFHLGLHRCPTRFPCFSHEEANIRRRLFWSIYCLERYLSQALGVPLSIQDDDIDVCYPGAERHGTESVGDHGADQGRLRMLTHLAKFARIRGLVLELRNKSILHSHENSLHAAQVNSELAQWWNEVYEDAYPMDDDHLDGSSEQEPLLLPYHRLLLIVLRHESVISMNRPLLTAERTSPEYRNALQACIESSRSLISALKNYISPGNSRSTGNLESYDRAPLNWPSFTWTTWMACLILMFTAWEGELPTPVALKYAQMSVSVLENLSLRGSTWPETCIEAIRGMVSALSTSLASANATKAQLSSSHSNERPFVTRDTPRRPDSLPSKEHIPLQEDNQTDLYSSPATSRQNTTKPSAVVPSGEIQDILNIPSLPSHNVSDVPEGQDTSFNTNPAGLIFGDMAGLDMSYHMASAGRDALPFSETTLGTNSLWSIADGPWMIYESFMRNSD
ncbi:hypothetical protein ASPZODRAFT_60917 [Penicilliopsis zonata CBS 506.65]|uniref:Xylanolytic transcriptional activator regulatory domain-containing protein n=1 Tax=Penicilliopsis zonata CBS 506.65 TaxID=1073090 RepID=A0A1L9SQT0_9EURO|nr:hypothetical protein ASPZODRAFT_60917 [Penicilliopsis zonata CBS 506.65]OJJ49476.1 hypothetical protein ASPZODRAFT_60917 [Penicilliopsis zonata CBS 506.65]